ncbi:MAG: hypothetical protein JW819_08090 [Candidatus Krumholzibacteriota bacterium]|nr:hypothetical protein [Candidatus Krumholzibacteriota bacterium]
MNLCKGFRVGIMVALLALVAAPAIAQDEGEWGDAPEGAMAYPSLGIIGNFPTCQNVGPANFIYHGALCWAFFGPSCDFEMEGNAGNCPAWPPYDADECFADMDAGLIMPPAYTIVPVGASLVVTPCTAATGFIDQFCAPGIWGGNIDIQVTNNMPVDGVVNVLFDWDQNGAWGGQSQCPGGVPAPEHVLVNFAVPMGFAGPLSLLGPPNFVIGPNPGYIWARFTISELPVQLPWDGSGGFEDGETEDYLIWVWDGVASQDRTWTAIKGLYR